MPCKVYSKIQYILWALVKFQSSINKIHQMFEVIGQSHVGRFTSGNVHALILPTLLVSKKGIFNLKGAIGKPVNESKFSI